MFPRSCSNTTISKTDSELSIIFKSVEAKETLAPILTEICETTPEIGALIAITDSILF